MQSIVSIAFCACYGSSVVIIVNIWHSDSCPLTRGGQNIIRTVNCNATQCNSPAIYLLTTFFLLTCWLNLISIFEAVVCGCVELDYTTWSVFSLFFNITETPGPGEFWFKTAYCNVYRIGCTKQHKQILTSKLTAELDQHLSDTDWQISKQYKPHTKVQSYLLQDCCIELHYSLSVILHHKCNVLWSPQFNKLLLLGVETAQIFIM